MRNLAVNLGKCLFAAHSEDGVSETNQQDDPGDMRNESSVKPPQRLLVELHDPGMEGIRRYLDRNFEYRVRAPENQNHYHYRGDGHDLQRLCAGFVDTLDVLPPEIESNQDREYGRKVIFRERKRVMHVLADVLDEACEVLAGRNGADWAGQDIIEKQCRNRKLG